MYSLFIIVKLFSVQGGPAITSFKAGEYETITEAINVFKDITTNDRSDRTYIVIKTGLKND